VNPRYTAAVEVLELALGRSLLAEHCRVFDPDFPAAPNLTQAPAHRFVAKRILFASTSCQFPDGDYWQPPGPDPFAVPAIGDVPHPSTEFEAGDPVLTVFAAGARSDECQLDLERKLGWWEQRIGAPAPARQSIPDSKFQIPDGIR
jgi:predicted ATP-grasp superfamily ATP-dependent carboligase